MDLQTKRLSIKELTLGDLNEIHRLHSLPEVDEFNTLGIPTTVKTTEMLLANWIGQQKDIPRNSYVFRVQLIETNQFIGLIALNLGKLDYKIADVWYKMLPAYWRQGYTTEALLRVIKFGFVELGLHRIEAGCAVENIASIKVLEKAGMTREGSKRNILPIRGKWVDSHFYSILETET
jgi:ribosomal-protein-alanine N-acetyltransferase